jgi:hypothetical protein
MTSILELLQPNGRSRTDGATEHVLADSRRSVADGAELRRRDYVLSAAEQAECSCPEFCERDHETD